MLVRLKNQSPDKVARVLLNVIKSDVKGKLENNLTIISEEKVIIIGDENLAMINLLDDFWRSRGRNEIKYLISYQVGIL